MVTSLRSAERLRKRARSSVSQHSTERSGERKRFVAANGRFARLQFSTGARGYGQLFQVK